MPATILRIPEPRKFGRAFIFCAAQNCEIKSSRTIASGRHAVPGRPVLRKRRHKFAATLGEWPERLLALSVFGHIWFRLGGIKGYRTGGGLGVVGWFSSVWHAVTHPGQLVSDGEHLLGQVTDQGAHLVGRG